MAPLAAVYAYELRRAFPPVAIRMKDFIVQMPITSKRLAIARLRSRMAPQDGFFPDVGIFTIYVKICTYTKKATFQSVENGRCWFELHQKIMLSQSPAMARAWPPCSLSYCFGRTLEVSAQILRAETRISLSVLSASSAGCRVTSP